MGSRLEMTEIERIDGFGLIVSFSDGTFAKYTVEQLANMIPNRSSSKTFVRGAAIVTSALDSLKEL